MIISAEFVKSKQREREKSCTRGRFPFSDRIYSSFSHAAGNTPAAQPPGEGPNTQSFTMMSGKSVLVSSWNGLLGYLNRSCFLKLEWIFSVECNASELPETPHLQPRRLFRCSSTSTMKRFHLKPPEGTVWHVSDKHRESPLNTHFHQLVEQPALLGSS